MAARPAPVFQIYRVSGGSGLWWRVVSPNGRALGRAATELCDLDAVRAHIEQVVTSRDRLEPMVRVTPSHRWRWQLALDGSAMVHGSAEQDRRVRCDAAWRSFVEIAASAAVDPVVHVFHRGYSPNPLLPTLR